MPLSPNNQRTLNVLKDVWLRTIAPKRKKMVDDEHYETTEDDLKALDAASKHLVKVIALETQHAPMADAKNLNEMGMTLDTVTTIQAAITTYRRQAEIPVQSFAIEESDPVRVLDAIDVAPAADPVPPTTP